MDHTELNTAIIRARYAIMKMSSEWGVALSDDELNWILGKYMGLLGAQDDSFWSVESVNAVAEKFESTSTKYSQEVRWVLMGMKSDYHERQGGDHARGN